MNRQLKDLPGLRPPSPPPSTDWPSPAADTSPTPSPDSVAPGEPGDAPPPPEVPPLEAWKAGVRADVERWLAVVESIPTDEDPAAADEASPDLYSFYEAFAVLSTECRKGNRRAAEVMSQSAESLAQVQRGLGELRQEWAEARAESGPEPEPALPRAHCLALIEILDRAQRLVAGFGQAPSPSWWGNDQRWRRAWDTQRQGLDILRTHVLAMLRAEGITPLEVAGQPFDPSSMAAVASEERPAVPDLTVIEEVAPGYTQAGEVLRVAQVKISRRAPPAPAAART